MAAGMPKALSMQSITNVQHIGRVQPDKATFNRRSIVHADGVFVIKLTIAVTIDGHPVRHQGVKGNDLTLAVICMADRSLTRLPAELPPKKKL